MKVENSALHTDRLYRPEDVSGSHFCWKQKQAQSLSATGTMESMKNGMT
jgi:hypothetical protein